MDGHGFHKRELAPIIALLFFVAAVLILCAVSAGKKADAREKAAAESMPQTQESVGDMPQTQENAEDTLQTQENAERIPQPRKTETAEAQSIVPVLEKETESTPSVSGGAGRNGTEEKTEEKTDGQMLAEMMDYWSKGNVEAVEDLCGLPRYRSMSASLQGPSYFYYYGDKDDQGKPEGTGIAVYGGDQYYYGQWSEGVRKGQGTWLKMYYYTDSDADADRTVVSHSYTGEWENNLPNGEGHEQYGLDTGLAEPGRRYLQNVIGNFSNGLYDGKMYLMTEDSGGNVQEWYGTASQGVFETFEGRDLEGRVPVCQDAKDPDSHLWIRPLDNIDLGVEEVRQQVTAQD